MTPQRSRLANVCQLLDDEDARYLVVGAIAMQLWGTTRATRDIDILIEPTIGNATRRTSTSASLIASKRTGRLHDLADVQTLEELQRLRAKSG